MCPHPQDAERHDPAEVVEAGLRNHHIANTAYPIAHDQTFGPYRVPRARHEEVVRAAWEGIAELGLYVHVPFCETRCSFCEYTVVGRAEAGDDSVRAYGDAVLAELDLWDRTIGLAGRKIGGLDVGGGTPSFVPASEIERFLVAIRARMRLSDDADISIETTPKIAAAEPDKLRAYRAMGIDRISMGIQVVQPDLLRVLNRDENGIEHHHRAVENMRRAAFERVNVDLMYGFHGQSDASWEATLAHAISLEPEYVTLYRMRYKLTRISHHAPHVTLEPVQRARQAREGDARGRRATTPTPARRRSAASQATSARAATSHAASSKGCRTSASASAPRRSPTRRSRTTPAPPTSASRPTCGARRTASCRCRISTTSPRAT